MISLPDDLLTDIDQAARRRGMTRSGLLAAAARRELSARDRDSREATIRRMEQRAEKNGWPTVDELLGDRAERDARDMRR